MALSDIGFAQGWNREGDNIRARRLENAKAMQDFMRSKAEMGEQVTYKDAISQWNNLTGGGSFIYGFSPDGLTEASVQAQNAKAREMQAATEVSTLASRQKEEDLIKNSLQPYLLSGAPIEKILAEAEKSGTRTALEKYLDKIPSWSQEATQQFITKSMLDPTISTVITPENMKQILPGLSDDAYARLEQPVRFAKNERDRQITASVIDSISRDKEALTLGLASNDMYAEALINMHAQKYGYQVTPEQMKMIKDAYRGMREEYVNGQNAKKMGSMKELITAASTIIASGDYEAAKKFMRSFAPVYGVDQSLLTDEFLNNIIAGKFDVNNITQAAVDDNAVSQQIYQTVQEDTERAKLTLGTSFKGTDKEALAAILLNNYIVDSDSVMQVSEAIANHDTDRNGLGTGDKSPIESATEIANQLQLYPVSQAQNYMLNKRSSMYKSFDVRNITLEELAMSVLQEINDDLAKETDPVRAKAKARNAINYFMSNANKTKFGEMGYADRTNIDGYRKMLESEIGQMLSGVKPAPAQKTPEQKEYKRKQLPKGDIEKMKQTPYAL